MFLLYPAIAPGNADENTEVSRAVTLLFTNDVESACDPISSFWIDGMSRIGDTRLAILWGITSRTH
ncbi:MAG: hypothetical protein IIB76_05190 [Proteobacteria bacterium]|nr:hypothetical protein [Pseudomonadota bacterium]